MLGKLLLLTVVALAYGRPQIQLDDDQVEFVSDDRCPEAKVHFLIPHESNCNQFYYCENGLRFVEPTECAPGTEFNAEKQVCVHANESGCSPSGAPVPENLFPAEVDQGAPVPEVLAPAEVDQGRPSSIPAGIVTTARPKPPGDGDLPNGCPADWDVHRLLPHEECNKFYYCLRGERTERKCAPNTYFNVKEQVCVHASQSDCSPSGAPVPENLLPEEIDQGRPSSIPAGIVTTARPKPPGDGDLPNGCPADWDVHRLLPHEECNKFYYCLRGERTERKCPQNTYFNVKEQVCVHASQSDCSPSGAPVPENLFPEEIDQGRPSSIPAGIVTTARPKPPGDGVLPNGCPADWDVHRLLPHEECNKFYYCLRGERTERKCPQNTYFNVKEQVCDWPGNVECAGNQDGNNPGGEPGGNKPGEGPGDNKPGIVVEWYENGCPTDHDIHWLLTHGTDCNMFYYCVHGNKEERVCSPGLHFNPKHQFCDWPENAGCGSDADVSVSGEYEPDLSDSNDSELSESNDSKPSESNDSKASESDVSDNSDISESNHSKPDLPGPDSKPDVSASGETSEEWLDNGCPRNFDRHWLLPSEYCGKFYYCVHGNKVQRECSPGLHFNADEQFCDWPQNVGCTGIDGPDDGGGSDEGQGTESPVDNSNEWLDNGCPVDFEKHWLLPSEDCGGFYYCLFGEKVERECPNNLHFNTKLQLCDWPENAGCGSDADVSVSGEYEPDLSDSNDPESSESNDSEPSESNDSQPSESNDSELSESNDSKPSESNDSKPSESDVSDNSDISESNHSKPDLPGPDSKPDVSASGETSEEWLDNGCPGNFDRHWLLPSEYCGKFYYCVHGNKVQRECSPGLHFNADEQFCDWPQNVGCTGIDGPDDGGGSDEGQGTESSVDNSNEWLDNGCPVDFEKHWLLPSEDCGGFYYCLFGEKVDTKCSGGLHFNAKLQVCDWPWNAGCERPDNSSENPKKPEPGSEDSNSSENVEEPAPEDNRCRNGCNVPPREHETDCDKYWRCEGDNEVLVTCSEGLHFNANTGTCDFICNAGCVRDQVESTGNAQGLKVFIPWAQVDEEMRETLHLQ